MRSGWEDKTEVAHFTTFRPPWPWP